MKIRTRLVLYYFFTSLILLLIFSIGTYLGMRQLLLNSLDNELDEKKDVIVDSYNPENSSFNFLNHPYFIENELSNFYLILYGSSNKVIFKTKLTELVDIKLPSTKTDTDYSANATIHKKNSTNSKSIIENVKFRITGSKIIFDNKNVGYLIIGQSFEKLYESMDNLLSVLLIGIGLATILIFLLSYFLTERSLKPIDKLINQAQQISHQNLGDRLDIQHREDEIGKLTIVLNDLLARIQNAFDKEQEFMADAAHELKTPLTVLRTHWEDELSSRELPDSFKQKLVYDIETITRLSKLINNLMLLSNTEYSQLRVDFEDIELSTLIKEVISNTNVLAELKNQTINTVELSNVTIKGDKVKLYQLFFNLIDNAIKYTPEHGNIYISLMKENDHGQIEVKDDGIGIPAEDIPNIFRRFYRVHKDRSKKMGGNGLGLAICKLITEMHDGNISVESKLGDGTLFTVKLPLNE